MITQDIIQEVTRRLVTIYNPLTIYLFGSYAWGNPDEESDLDLLIVVEESSEKKHKRGITGSRALRGMMLPKDIVVYTRQEFDESATHHSSLCFLAKTRGKVLYAKGH